MKRRLRSKSNVLLKSNVKEERAWMKYSRLCFIFIALFYFYFGGKENATQWRQKRKQKTNALPLSG